MKTATAVRTARYGIVNGAGTNIITEDGTRITDQNPKQSDRIWKTGFTNFLQI